VLELILSLVFEVLGDLIGIILEPLLGSISSKAWPDLANSSIFWGIVILILAGIIGWELR
jgi:hypothetical protein